MMRESFSPLLLRICWTTMIMQLNLESVKLVPHWKHCKDQQKEIIFYLFPEH